MMIDMYSEEHHEYCSACLYLVNIPMQRCRKQSWHERRVGLHIKQKSRISVRRRTERKVSVIIGNACLYNVERCTLIIGYLCSVP